MGRCGPAAQCRGSPARGNMHGPWRTGRRAVPAMLGAGALALSVPFVTVVAKAPLGTEIERGPEEPGRIGETRRIGVAVIVAVVAIRRCGIAGGWPVSHASAKPEPKPDGQPRERSDREIAVDHRTRRYLVMRRQRSPRASEERPSAPRCAELTENACSGRRSAAPGVPAEAQPEVAHVRQVSLGRPTTS